MSFKKVDALAADILDEAFVKIFKPLHLVQKLIGFHRVNIDFRFVTVPSTYYKLCSSALWVLNAIALVHYVVSHYPVLGTVATDTMIKRNLIIFAVLNTAIAWQNNFCYENLNSQLYVKLQKIDRELKLGSSALLNERLAVFSATTMFIVTSLSIAWSTTCSLILAKKIYFPFVFAMFMAMANYLEIYLLFHILFFVIIRVIYVNDILRAKLSIYTTSKNEDTMKDFKEKYVWSMKSNEKSQNDGFQELVYGVHSILDTLADIVTLFRFPVLSFASQVFLCNLNLVQCVIDSLEQKMSTSSYLWITAILPDVTLGILLLIISITSGFLNQKLEVTKKLSLHIKLARRDGTSRQHSKQLLTLLTKERCVLSIYNIFFLDYRLPLQMFAIIATYTIVLLQIATL